ncbi:MAG: hypothetical protein V4547_16480 [Bacteroidota bacterium]
MAAKKEADQFTRKWITANSIEIIEKYERGILTIRALHYQLVGRGMTNSIQHYKRVVEAMGVARWAGLVDFEAFSDHDREVMGQTWYQETVLEDKIETGKQRVKDWMEWYSKNRWENQHYAPEVWIEKKALQGVFQRPCENARVALAPCKGYPSLTFLNDAKERFLQMKADGKEPIILYFGDYDPSGEDIPRSIAENLSKMGCPVEVKRIALMEHQVLAWKLPPAPAKVTDSRTMNWDGLGQVELDAVEPNVLRKLVDDAVAEYFDQKLYSELLTQASREKAVYQKELKEFVIQLASDIEDEDSDE